MFFFANLIQSIIQISFLLMVLSPAALAAHTEFQSVFCVTRGINADLLLILNVKSYNNVIHLAEIGSRHEDCPPSPDCFHYGFTVLRIIGTVLLVALGLVMALFYYSKKR